MLRTLIVEREPETIRYARVHDVRVPTFIYGTAWKEDDTARLTHRALDAGFRGIDTANQRRHYHEAGVERHAREAGGVVLLPRRAVDERRYADVTHAGESPSLHDERP